MKSRRNARVQSQCHVVSAHPFLCWFDPRKAFTSTNTSLRIGNSNLSKQLMKLLQSFKSKVRLERIWSPTYLWEAFLNTVSHIFVFSPIKHILILHHSNRLHGWPPLPRGNPQEFPPLDCQPTYRCLRKRRDTRSTLQLWQWTSPSPLCKWVANCAYHMMNTSNDIIFELYYDDPSTVFCSMPFQQTTTVEVTWRLNEYWNFKTLGWKLANVLRSRQSESNHDHQTPYQSWCLHSFKATQWSNFDKSCYGWAKPEPCAQTCATFDSKISCWSYRIR